ncbi:MAG: hypothetical protein RL215_1963 [Planctomycetota bacterium]
MQDVCSRRVVRGRTGTEMCVARSEAVSGRADEWDRVLCSCLERSLQPSGEQFDCGRIIAAPGDPDIRELAAGFNELFVHWAD